MIEYASNGIHENLEAKPIENEMLEIIQDDLVLVQCRFMHASLRKIILNYSCKSWEKKKNPHYVSTCVSMRVLLTTPCAHFSMDRN